MVWQQLLGMVLYSLFMALNLASCLLLFALNGRPYTFDWAAVLLIWLVLFILPASTALCGALFGSWRGALVAAFSTGGGLLLTQGLTSVSPDLQAYWSGYARVDFRPYLISGPLAALVVGLLYDFRQDENGGKSLAIMALGMAIAFFGLALTAQSSFLGCVFLFLIPVSAFTLACLELLVRKLLAPRGQRPPSRAEAR